MFLVLVSICMSCRIYVLVFKAASNVIVMCKKYYLGTFSLFRNVLPEAICCCLQTCYVDVMLLLMVYTNFYCCHFLVCLVTYTNSSLL